MKGGYQMLMLKSITTAQGGGRRVTTPYVGIISANYIIGIITLAVMTPHISVGRCKSSRLHVFAFDENQK